MSKKLVVDINEKIYKDIPRVNALEKVKFEIKSKEVVCILGPSGCGKTTLLRLISGLDKDFSGKVMVGERMVEGPARDCGLVFQEPRLLPWFSVVDNIKFGLYSNNKDEVMPIINKLLNLLDLSEFKTSYPSQLSGGMQQKVALARALINIPDLLLLDEPFASVDKITKMKLQQEVSEVLKKKQTTTLMVTHDIEEAIFFSDRILIMSPRPGKIIKSYNVNLPHPRNRGSEEFIKIYLGIMEFMRKRLKVS